MKMARIYSELKVTYQKEAKNLPQLNKRNREIDRLGLAKQTSEEVIKSLRNLTSIRIATVLDKKNKIKQPTEKSRKRKRNNTNHDKRECWTKERNKTNQEDTTTENANRKCRIKQRDNADQGKTATDTNRMQWKDEWNQ